MSDAQSDPHPHLTSLLTKGYTLLPSLLSPSQLLALRAAASKLTTLARQGKWPHVRTLGKQFPPWDSALVARGERGIWGVQHLLHPELPLSQEEERGVFVGVYFDSRVLGVVQEVTGAQEGDLVMELMNMLVHPEGEGIRPLKGGGEGFELRWHRDDIPWTVGPEEEQALLDRQRVTVSIGGEERTVYNHAQWNIALYDDESLVVVPGSHLRSRTEVERNADPYEPNLPGMEVVKLKAGDAVFYDSNILHRGVYVSGKERLTLHGSVGHVRGSRDRARNVLQHGVGEWVGRCDLSVLGERGTAERERAEGMRERLIEMGTEKVEGYSLEG